MSVKQPAVRRRSKKKSAAFRPDIATSIVVLCALISLLVAAHYWLNSGEIYRGVRAGGVDLGGQTRAEARKTLRERTAGFAELRLRGPRELTFDARELGVRFDVDAAVEDAYAVGREGSLPARLLDRLDAAVGIARVSPHASYDREAVRRRIETLAEKLNKEPREPGVEIDGTEVRVTDPQDGYKLDVEATLDNVNSAIENVEPEAEAVGEPVEPRVPASEAEEAADRVREAVSDSVALTAGDRRWEIPPDAVGRILRVERSGENLNVRLDERTARKVLGEVYSALTVRAIEAGFILKGGEIRVTPGLAGKQVDEDRLFREMESGLFDGDREYRVPVKTVRPELTTAEAERLKPTTLLGEYQTDYTWDTDPGRRANMAIASDAINGTTLAPGEVFSYNAIAEPLDYEKAKVIENGAVEYAEGGGLSQVSTTLYMAANLAGLEIIEAHPHYAELPYIRPGFDTTVWFGALDLRFKNNTGGYVLIQQWQGNDGFNHARIYGPETGKEVTMTSEKVFDGEDRKGKPTTRWVVYKTITQNGKVIYDGVFRRVTYKELDPYEPEKTGSR